MLIVQLSGGLGNQMFQYAAAYALAKKNRQECILDISQYEKNSRKFELDYFKIANKRCINRLPIIGNLKIPNRFKSLFYAFFNNNKIFVENNPFEFDERIRMLKNNIYLIGYFQNEKYFSEYENDIRLIYEFQENNPLSYYSNQIKFDNNSVSIHIRRGDYVSDSNANHFHGICSEQYYSAALNTIEGKIKTPNYYIFSDEILWVKNNMNFPKNSIYIENEYEHPIFEMNLMSMCKHNIIANSSFSWWGAWLNKNPSKVVIAPKRWILSEKYETEDIIPKNWIKI